MHLAWHLTSTPTQQNGRKDVGKFSSELQTYADTQIQVHARMCSQAHAHTQKEKKKETALKNKNNMEY